MLRIKKVKITKEDKIQINYEQRNKKDGYDEFSMLCAERAAPDFYAAIHALPSHVIDMCELPKDRTDRIQVTGVSFSYGGDAEIMGATIIAQLILTKSVTALNLNTPHKIAELYSDGGDPATLLSGDCVDALIELQEECCKYIAGEREQTSLGLEEKVEQQATMYRLDNQPTVFGGRG